MPDSDDERWSRISAESELRPDHGIVADVPAAQITPLPDDEPVFDPIELNEVPLPPEAKTSAQPTSTMPVGLRAVTLSEGVRLRQSPALNSELIGGLAFGTEIYVITQIPSVESNDIRWFYVQTPLGNGWVAENLITFIR